MKVTRSDHDFLLLFLLVFHWRKSLSDHFCFPLVQRSETPWDHHLFTFSSSVWRSHKKVFQKSLLCERCSEGEGKVISSIHSIIETETNTWGSHTVRPQIPKSRRCDWSRRRDHDDYRDMCLPKISLTKTSGKPETEASSPFMVCENLCNVRILQHMHTPRSHTSTSKPEHVDLRVLP